MIVSDTYELGKACIGIMRPEKKTIVLWAIQVLRNAFFQGIFPWHYVTFEWPLRARAGSGQWRSQNILWGGAFHK